MELSVRRYTYENGNTYAGQCVKDSSDPLQPHGRGVYNWLDGSRSSTHSPPPLLSPPQCTTHHPLFSTTTQPAVAPHVRIIPLIPPFHLAATEETSYKEHGMALGSTISPRATGSKGSSAWTHKWPAALCQAPRAPPRCRHA